MSTPEQRRDFERCANEHRPDLYRYASWVCGDTNVAEDAVQEALIRAWRSWGELRDDSAVKSWLRTIVRRECARLFERKRPTAGGFDAVAEIDERSMDAAEHDAAAAELQRAVMGMEAKYREPLLLQALMGYSVTEIARIVGMKPGAVLTRLCRARRQLLSSLQVV
jgi:RNA polymerase sigma-70 factor (ECF subfamily)